MTSEEGRVVVGLFEFALLALVHSILEDAPSHQPWEVEGGWPLR